MRRPVSLLLCLLSSLSLTCAGTEPPGDDQDLGQEAADLTMRPPDPTGSDGAAGAPDLTARDQAAPAPDLSSAGPLVRFVAFGDTGKGNSGQREVADAVQRKCAMSGCDFAVLLGDNIYDSGVDSVNDSQWQSKFEQPYAMLNFPFYAVLGNHDYGAGGAGSEFGKGEHQVKYSMKSMKWRMPAPHYHFTEKHVEFFGLDTNLQMWGFADKQKSDMRAWIAASTATWKIALGHHPYLSNGRHGNAGSYDGVPWIPIANGQGVKEFMEQVVCGKVDLYLCGHDHSRQWLEATCNGTELVISGAGASTTDLPGKNKSRFQAKALGFLYVRIEGRTLTADFLNTAGAVEFTRTLTK